jgi:hypothetical protein
MHFHAFFSRVWWKKRKKRKPDFVRNLEIRIKKSVPVHQPDDATGSKDDSARDKKDGEE